MREPSRNEFTDTNRANLKILRDSSILFLSLSLSLSVFFFFPTCVVLAPLEDRSKRLSQFVERVFIHSIHPPQDEPEGAPFLRSAMAQSISSLPLRLNATCGMAYDALMSPLPVGSTQIWEGLHRFGKLPKFGNNLKELFFAISLFF